MLFPLWATYHQISHFQNICEWSIHKLLPSKYNHTHEIYDYLKYENEKGNVQVNFFVLNEEFIDYFHDEFYITMIDKLSFHLTNVIIIVSLECVKIRYD